MKIKEPLYSLLGLGLFVAPGPEPTGSLEVWRGKRLVICDDNEDAENRCLQEDLKVLKVQGVENFKFHFLHLEMLVSVFQIKRSVTIRAF